MIKLKFSETEGQPEVEVPPEGISIGRNLDCDLPIIEGSVSGHHASLRPEGGAWVLRDEGSTNGTLHNGMPVVDSVTLRNGDRVQFGRVVVEVSVLPDPLVAPSPAANGPRKAFVQLAEESPAAPADRSGPCR